MVVRFWFEIGCSEDGQAGIGLANGLRGLVGGGASPFYLMDSDILEANPGPS